MSRDAKALQEVSAAPWQSRARDPQREEKSAMAAHSHATGRFMVESFPVVDGFELGSGWFVLGGKGGVGSYSEVIQKVWLHQMGRVCEGGWAAGPTFGVSREGVCCGVCGLLVGGLVLRRIVDVGGSDRCLHECDLDGAAGFRDPRGMVLCDVLLLFMVS